MEGVKENEQDPIFPFGLTVGYLQVREIAGGRLSLHVSPQGTGHDKYGLIVPGYPAYEV